MSRRAGVDAGDSGTGAIRPGDSQRPSGGAAPPRVWPLTGHRTGDNAQVLALAEALGWPCEVKRFVYVPYERLVNLPGGSSLIGVVMSRSSRLEPPWPQLVISAGRRNEPIARWIRKQAGGDVRLVHVGRPWAAIESWDLVVTTPQYRLPRLPNVLHNETPLHQVTPQRLAQAAAEWGPRVTHLARPYVVVLVGGPSGPFSFDADAGARLAAEASALASKLGGSLLVTTSARTPAAASEALLAGIRVPAWCHRWTAGATDNPYFGFLGLADQLVVTADSMSMMTEACATGKPVHLFDTGVGRTAMHERAGAAPTALSLRQLFDPRLLHGFVYRQTLRFGPRRLTRDIRIIQRQLVASGRAVWLGEGSPSSAPPRLEDVPRAVARVRALFEASADSGTPERSR